MFEQLYCRPTVIARHRGAPYAEERERYLNHCFQAGYSLSTIRLNACELLWVARKLSVYPTLSITGEQLEAVAQHWEERQQCCGRSLNTAMTRARFINVARPWLRFLGCFREPSIGIPFADQLAEYAQWLADERGLSSTTIRVWSQSIGTFFRWYRTRHASLCVVRIDDIDDFVADCAQRGLSRVTIRNLAYTLRGFFRYAGHRGWCASTLAEAIQRPRVYAQETLPAGPAWGDVKMLLASMDTDCPADIRDRAILMLFAIYGLRANEVAHLHLDDIDWTHSHFRVPRTKLHQNPLYPLVASVGEAIIRYLQLVRPTRTHRELFLTLKAPFRPLSPSGLHGLTSKRLRALGVTLPHYGPHALRHACAARLVAEGFSFKAIGDHLGHRSIAATQVYAKVDLAGLREVAAFDLGGLL